MTRTTLTTVLMTLVVLISSGCKSRAPDAEDPSVDAAPTPEKPAPSPEGAGGAASTETITADLKAIPVPEGWRSVSAKTPKGAEVSIGVPSAWVESPVPSSATLFELAAPEGDPMAGARISGIVLPFTGELDKLVAYNRKRLASFATIHADGVIGVGDSEAYEVAASWTADGQAKDSVQLMIATGGEGIGFLCMRGTAMDLEALRPFCEQVFATHSITEPAKAE